MNTSRALPSEEQQQAFLLIHKHLAEWLSQGVEQAVSEIEVISPEFNACNMNYTGIIHLAISMVSGVREELLSMLINDLIEVKGVDVNECNNRGESALILAAKRNAHMLIMKLLRLGARVDQQDINGNNAVALADAAGAELIKSHLEATATLVAQEQQVDEPEDDFSIRQFPLTDDLIKQLTDLQLLADQFEEFEENKFGRNLMSQIRRAIKKRYFDENRLRATEEVFERRWSEIKTANGLRYDVQLNDPINGMFYRIARLLASEVAVTEGGKSLYYFKLLFPTLTEVVDTFGQSISSFNMENIIVGGNHNEGFVDINECLRYAISEENIDFQLYRTFATEGATDRSPLTDDEVERISLKSSTLAAIVASWKVVRLANADPDILTNILGNFSRQFRSSGNDRHARGRGTEYRPHDSGLIAVAEFCEFINCLSEEQNGLIHSLVVSDGVAAQHRSFAHLWDVLVNPEGKTRDEVCIVHVAESLAALIQSNREVLDAPAVIAVVPDLTQKITSYLSNVPDADRVQLDSPFSSTDDELVAVMSIGSSPAFFQRRNSAGSSVSAMSMTNTNT